MSSAAPQPREARSSGEAWETGSARSRAGRATESALARARLTVVPRPQARASQTPFLLLVSLLLVAGVVGLLMFNTSMQQASFAESALEDQATALTAQEESLRVQLEDLRNPQRIAEQAQHLGMVQPTNWCSLTLGGPVTCKAPPARAGAPLRLHDLPPVKPAALDPDPVVVHPPRDTDAGSPAGGHARGRNDTTRHNQHTNTTRHSTR